MQRKTGTKIAIDTLRTHALVYLRMTDKKRASFTVRDAALTRALHARARKDQRTLSDTIRILLRFALKAEARAHG